MNLNFNDRTGNFEGFTPRSVQPDTKGLESALGCFGLIMLIPLMVIISSVVNGAALVQLWAWFVVPTFPALPVLTLPVAIGFSLIVSHFKGSAPSDPEGKAEAKRSPGLYITKLVLKILLTPVVTLILGYIVQSFM